MPSPNNVLTADSYIQDGLVFQLDGIEYGGIDGQWIDRRNADNVFNRTGNVIYNENHFEFKGGFFSKREMIRMPKSNTLEASIFIKERTNCGIVSIGSPLGLLSRGNILYTRYGGQTGPCFVEDIGYHLISTSENNIVQNGVIPNFDIGAALNYRVIDARIGTLNSQFSSFVFKGSIYAIRVYNRQLSDREILINQKIDNARFGLGLDIPDEVLPASRSLSLLEHYELPDESESEEEPTNDNSDER